MTLGERVLVLRRRLKLSQSMLARAAGVDTNTIARLERNEILDLSGARILRLAKALQVSTDMLLGAVELDEPTSEVSPTGTALVGT